MQARRAARDNARPQQTKTEPAAIAAVGRDPDMVRLFHELHTHKTELQVQNEELRHTRAELEAALARYTSLYEHAPVGFMTLDPDGKILGLNACAAGLLGAAGKTLANKFLPSFILFGERMRFRGFINRVLHGAEGTRHVTETVIGLASGTLHVHVTAVLFPPENKALLLALEDAAARPRADDTSSDTGLV